MRDDYRVPFQPKDLCQELSLNSVILDDQDPARVTIVDAYSMRVRSLFGQLTAQPCTA